MHRITKQTLINNMHYVTCRTNQSNLGYLCHREVPKFNFPTGCHSNRQANLIGRLIFMISRHKQSKVHTQFFSVALSYDFCPTMYTPPLKKYRYFESGHVQIPVLNSRLVTCTVSTNADTHDGITSVQAELRKIENDVKGLHRT